MRTYKPYCIQEVERMARGFQVQPDGCWQWQKQINYKGYGIVRVSFPERGQKPAHRYMYELVIDTIPAGLVLDHLCRNRACVNPYHLEPVTPKENTMRGIGPTALNAKKTHCPRNHEYKGTNLYAASESERQCRACMRIHRQKYQAKQAINNQQSKGE